MESMGNYSFWGRASKIHRAWHAFVLADADVGEKDINTLKLLKRKVIT